MSLARTRTFASAVVVPTAAAALLAAASPADAATIAVGARRAHQTIGSAVAAAAPGDRIVVDRGTYDETVTVTTARVKIVGKPGAVWRPETYNAGCLTFGAGADGGSVTGFVFRGRGTGVTVLAPGVLVDRCVFRACSMGISANADDLTVTRSRLDLCGTAARVDGHRTVFDANRAAHSSSDMLAFDGDDVRVTRSTVHGSGDDYAIDVFGDRALVEANRTWSTWNCGVYIRGNDARVVRNTVRSVTSDDGIEVTGDRAVIDRNVVDGAYSDGVHVQGADATITSNAVSSVGDDGIDVRGESFEVRGNTVTDCSDPSGGIRADNGTGLATKPAVVAQNVVRDITGGGFEIWGVGVRVERNRVVTCGDSAFEFFGSAHVVEDCVAEGPGSDGFGVHAAGTTLTACAARDAGRDGFYLDGDNASLTKCTSAGAAADGLHGAAATMSFTGCTFRTNRVDVASSGMTTMTDGGGNDWDTGGPGTTPVH